ncbi:MAG: HPP family protein, partial [Chloroflexota bacterium]|nr:HPP family protein [Chloroflexota bacterium]
MAFYSRQVSDRSLSRGQQHEDGPATRHASLPGRRGGLWGELALAVPPTLLVLIVILSVESVARQRLLFASLASSAFLIYYVPLERMNGVRVMVLAQGIACCAGVIAALLLGEGYSAGACAMVATILLLIAFDIVH